MGDLRKSTLFQVVCPVISTINLEDVIHETSLDGVMRQAKATMNALDMADHGFFLDEEEARREAAARLRIHRDAIDKQIIENDVAIAKLREGRRGSPVRPVKVTKK